MIYTFKELQDYQLEIGNFIGDLEGSVLASINLDKEEVRYKLTKANINMPESYLDIITKYNVAGVSVGYFELSPTSGEKDIIKDLITTNADEDVYFPVEFMRRNKMYYIASASFDAEVICIGAKGSKWGEGEILLLDFHRTMYNPQDEEIHPIAKNFEQFLIAAGNLNLIHCLISDDLENEKKHIEEFCNTLKKLGMEDRYIEVWERFF